MLVQLWLLLQWDFEQPFLFKKLLGQLTTLVLSTLYWVLVAALLTLVVSHLS